MSKMRACTCLLLVFLTLVAAVGSLSMEETFFSNEEIGDLEYWISSTSGPRNSTHNFKTMTLIKEEKTKNLQTLSPFTMKKSGGSWKDSYSLLMLLVGMIKAELSQCILAIVQESVLAGSIIIDSLTLLPNVKQIVESGNISKLLWKATQCTGYIFLLTSPSSLMDHVENAAHDAWDYSGRMIVVGLTKSQIDTLTTTDKGRKTEHILGIVQNTDGHFTVLMNQLYKNNRLSRVLTWRTDSKVPNKSSSIRINPKHMFNDSIQPPTTPNFPQLFPDKTKDLLGFSLIAVCFPIPPAVTYRYDNEGNVVRYGDDVRVVEAVAEILNFTPVFREPPGGTLWGHQLPNGSWTGMVGTFERGEADVGIGNLFISDVGGRDKHQHYTAPFGQEIMCFMIKKGTSTPRWQSLALPFSITTWIALLIMAVLLGPIFFALSRFSFTSKDEKLRQKSLAFINLYTFGVHLRVAQTQLPVSLSLQIFVAFLWVYVIIVLEAYSAKLVSFLTVERIPEGINTIEELYHASLTIYGNTYWYYDSFALAKNEYARKLADRFTLLMEFERGYKNILDGKAAYIASANNLMYTISLYARNGNPSLKLVKECFQPYNTALGVQSHSPLKRNLDQAVNWVRQAGLPYQFRRETLMTVRQEKKTILSDSTDAPETEEEKRVSFSLEHLQSVFIMFGVGISLSMLVFTSEVLFSGFT